MKTIIKVVSRNFIMDWVARFQNIVGSNLTGYEKMIQKGVDQCVAELNKRNIDMDKLSLHLHNQSDKQNIKNIILYAMKNEINKFDVSYMPEIGGCSVTMKETHGNLGYEQIYECM